MSEPPRSIVVIPARMASARLPGKPLADIHGEPMIVHVWRRSVEAGIGPVVVACAEPEIAEAIEAVGGRAVMTRSDHVSGSDRVFEAVKAVDPEGRYGVVVNVQGDLPTIDPKTVAGVHDEQVFLQFFHPVQIDFGQGRHLPAPLKLGPEYQGLARDPPFGLLLAAEFHDAVASLIGLLGTHIAYSSLPPEAT